MTKGKDIDNKLLSREEIIELKEFMLLDSKKQELKIRETLDKMYGEGEVPINAKQIDKVLNVAFDTKDTQAYLPKNVYVDKVGNKLIFTIRKNNNFGLLLIFSLAFLFLGGFATFTGVQYLGRAQMNIDLDGDGIADLNIDLDDDGICDVNCDRDKDGKPDRNIDYHGGRKAIFNVLLPDNTISNPINQDLDGDGKCDLNCDTNDDGWPDLNIDYDNDGEADLDRDIDGDGIKDLDLDINGDGVCDINCDENKDNKCDRNCTNVDITDNGNGTSSSTGDGGLDISTASLVVKFDETNTISIDDVYPDDQPGYWANKEIPDVTFTVENTTNQTLYYDIRWYEVFNDFESDNFWFKISSNHDGYAQDWSTVPKEEAYMTTMVAIPAKTKQHYKVEFKLHGIDEPQDYDQGKTFRGKIRINLIDIKDIKG